MALIKDNHLAAYKNIKKIKKAIQNLKKKRIPVEIEVTSLKQFRAVISSNPDIIMLDNMTQSDMKKAVALNKKKAGKKILMEASGGITLKNIKTIAKTGVDRISIGALTHSAVNLDFSMDLKSL
jgi:nicotinate-nucleotide pyrophosphorylase (carboxylating)